MRVVLFTTLCSCGVGRVYIGLTQHGGKDAHDDAVISGGDTGSVFNPNLPKPMGSPGAVPVSTPVDKAAPACGRGEVSPAVQSPVHFMFVLDRSGSMNDTNEAKAQGRVTKWEAFEAAMRALFDDMGKTPGGVSVGVDWFSESDSSTSSSARDQTIEQPMAAMTRTYANALMDDVAGRYPAGLTPTQAALTISYPPLASYAPDAGANKALVFVSDGKPNPALTVPVADLITPHTAAGIKTYAIGIGEPTSLDGNKGYDPVFMSQVAHLGGTAKAGCDPTSGEPAKFCHFQVTPSQSQNVAAELFAAFNEIRAQQRSCTLALNIEKPNELEPRAVIVIRERPGEAQMIVPRDMANGWTFDNPAAPRAVLLHGSECEVLKADPTVTVFALLGCACTSGVHTPVGGSGEGGGGRAAEGEGEGGTPGNPWDTDWCNYPHVPYACSGEGCQP